MKGDLGHGSSESDQGSLRLQIGGITLGFSYPAGTRILMPGAFAEFYRRDPAHPVTHADLELRVRRVSAIPASPGALLFDSGGSWKLYREAAGALTFACHSPNFGAAPYQVARVDAALSKGEILLDDARFPAGNPVAGLEYPLGELLLQHLLCSRRGIEIHASGVMTEDGRGYLFAAQSGGGKTTMSRLWQAQAPVRILSDDRIVLRVCDGKVVMHGTPWHGEGAFSEALSVSLTAICFLQKTEHNALTHINRSLAVARLLSTSFVPFYDSQLMGGCLDTLEHIVRLVPTYELGFVPTPEVVEFVLKHAA